MEGFPYRMIVWYKLVNTDCMKKFKLRCFLSLHLFPQRNIRWRKILMYPKKVNPYRFGNSSKELHYHVVFKAPQRKCL
jgi:hypothetical protein